MWPARRNLFVSLFLPGTGQLLESGSRTVDAGVGWFREPEPREVGMVPGFAQGAVRALLPGFLEDKVADAQLRLTPERVSFGGSYFEQTSSVFRYEEIVELPGGSQQFRG